MTLSSMYDCPNCGGGTEVVGVDKWRCAECNETFKRGLVPK